MQLATERFTSFVALARARHTRRIRFAALMAVLIAVLLWRTQWPTLWPGLAILLCTQLGAALLLVDRNRKLSSQLRLLHNETHNEASFLHWFDTERTFLTRLAFYENGARTLGFLALAYGFWVPTRNLSIALALGVIYPVLAYLGMARQSSRRIINELQSQKKELQSLHTP